HGEMDSVSLPMLSRNTAPAGWWSPRAAPLGRGEDALRAALHRLSEPLSLVEADGEAGVGIGGSTNLGGEPGAGQSWPVRAWVAPCRPEHLGDAQFRADHGLRYAYCTG